MSNFPVVVTNPPTLFPDDFLKSTVSFDDQSSLYENTVANINSAGGYGIQILGAGSNLSRNLFIRGVYLSSSSPVLLSIAYSNNGFQPIYLWVGDGYFNGYLPINYTLRPYGVCVIRVVKAIGADSDTVRIGSRIDAYSYTFDLTSAKSSIRFYGDSITNDYGITEEYQHYQVKLVQTLRELGKSVKYDAFGLNGTSSANWLKFMNNNSLESGLDTCAAVFICLGTNDADAGNPNHTSTAVYKSNMKAMAKRFITCPENPNLQVVLIGAVPLSNSTNEANAVLQRAALYEIQTELASIAGTRLHVISMTSAYDPSDSLYSDGVHPTALGHQAIIDNKITPWMATTDGQQFINGLI